VRGREPAELLGQRLAANPAPPEAMLLRLRNTARFIPASKPQELTLLCQVRPQSQRPVIPMNLPLIIPGEGASKCTPISVGDKFTEQLGSHFRWTITAGVSSLC
jgi:hypothetical protein